MAASLPQPGVEVIQVFQTVTPTVITPTLVPCVVGVCKQVVDVLTQSATGANILNSQALVALQASAVAIAAEGSPPVYALDPSGPGNLDLSLNMGPPVTISFAGLGASLTPEQVVAQVLLELGAAGVSSYTAETVGTDQWRLLSVAANQYQTIQVLGTSDPVILASFGFGAGRTYEGSTYYTQDSTDVLTSSFPNPNNNLSQLVIDPTTVRAFLYLGGSNGSSALLELLQTEAFLQNGIGAFAQKVGTVNMSTFAYGTAAVVTGTTDVTAAGLYGPGGTLATGPKTLILNVNGAGPLTLTFDSAGLTNDASSAAMLAAIHTLWPAITATIVATHLVLTDSTLGLSSTVVVGAGTANAALGLTAGTTTGTNTLDGLTLIETFNGGSALTTTFSDPTDSADLLLQINAVISGVATADLQPTTNYLRITTLLDGAGASILTGAGTANTAVGFSAGTVNGTTGVQALDSGNGTALTNLLSLTGGAFTTNPTVGAQVTGTTTAPAATALAGLTLVLDDGSGQQTLTFSSVVSPPTVIAQINALFGEAAGGNLLATLSAGKLRLTNQLLGVTSIIRVGVGTADTLLGLTSFEGTTVRGAPFAPLPGDELWIDGVDYATIVQVAPGGNASQLKINTQVPISSNVGLAWYIQAKNLSPSLPAALTIPPTRPFPNLVVDGLGDCVVKPEVLRNTQGNPVYPSLAQLYIQYKALRLDVTPLAAHPGLLTFGDTTTLANQLGPVTTDNPLALGLYFALLNAQGTQVTGLGVDEYTGDAPYGTIEAYTRAATFLEGYEVYGLAPLTHDSTVAEVFQAHVDLMSGPTYKGERIVLVNLETPTHYLDALVASGTNGNTTPTTNQFDAGVHNLDALLLAKGLSSAGPYPTSDGIYLDIGDGNHYNVVNVIGTVAVIKTSGFLPGENSDGYYATTTLPSPLISETFAIRIRGAALLLPNGQPDLTNIAVTVQQTNQGFADRRVWSTFPDQCSATLDGVQQVLEGFYLNAAIVGMIAKNPPQQSFTNYPMTGFNSVIGSNDTFGTQPMNVMAAGGTYIIVQDGAATPLYSRMALTTDMTSIETRTDSITKVVDFTAKFLRTGLKNYIGRFNITQGFLDTLGHVLQGMLGFLTESGVLIGANLNNIVQDTSAPDTVLIDVTLDVPYPCNYIRLTLTI